MSKLYDFKILIFATISLLYQVSSVAQSRIINVDIQNPVIISNQIYFDVYLSAGEGYDGKNQEGGEWTGMSIPFDLDFTIVSGNPVLGTSLGNELVITNKNASIIDNTLGSVTGANDFLGNSPLGYKREYRLDLKNSDRKPLPTTPTYAFSVSIKCTGGIVAADATSANMRVRSTASSKGAIWSNGVLYSQTVLSAEPQRSFGGTNLKEEALHLTAASGINLADNKAAHILVYPNPVPTSHLTIEMSSIATDEQVQLVIYDALGKQVHKQHVKLQKGINQFGVDIQQFSSGTYFLKLVGASLPNTSIPFIRVNN